MPSQPISEKNKITFPSVQIISASAGSGKTHTMAMRLTQFLLSEPIKNNDLSHILAITFTNLAAKELKERLILTLKKLVLRDAKTCKDFAQRLPLSENDLALIASELLDKIFIRYADLQVKTIDSFFSKVFRAGAHDFGFYSDCAITFNTNTILDRAFEEMSKELANNEILKNQLIQLTGMIEAGNMSKDRFLWNPFNLIKKEVLSLYTTISRLSKPLYQEDRSALFNSKRNHLFEAAHRFLNLVELSELNIDKNLSNELQSIMNNDFNLVDKTIKTKSITATKNPKDKIRQYEAQFHQMLSDYNRARMDYHLAEAQNFYYPYVVAYQLLQKHIQTIQRDLGEVALDDIHRLITGHYEEETAINPLYEKLGDTLYHFMIDEFQDTSPVHWKNLVPLIDNALSQGGSLFVVGDTKQSIYSFNGADWRILNGLMNEAAEANKTFPSVARYSVDQLETNYRSGQAIVDFNRDLFHSVIPKISDYQTAVAVSGLSSYKQEPIKDNMGKGYVEINLFELNGDYTTKIIDAVNDLRSRNVALKDIAILARKNDEVISVSELLKSNGIDCISYSNLDIRQQTLTNEIFSLLNFLDSPIDNLSFAHFLLGGIFNSVLGKTCIRTDWHEFILKHRGKTLYKAFMTDHPDLWNRYFNKLFTQTGYLPLYDMVAEIFKIFELFTNFSHETATLTKFLETAKQFEQDERNSIKEFLSSSIDHDNDAWKIRVSRDLNAVRVLTVHKAKGLDFGYVIVLIKQGIDSSHPKPYVLEFDDHTELIKINSHLSDRSVNYSKFTGSDDHDFHFLFERYQQESLINTVEKLNTLYVGFTRPKHELYIVGVKTYSYKEKDSLNYLRTSESFYGTKHTPESQEHAPEMKPPFLFNPESNIKENQTVHKLKNDERRRGDNIHFVLSKIQYLNDDIQSLFHEIIEQNLLPFEQGLNDQDLSLLTEFLKNPELKPFFNSKPDRFVFNEKDIVDSDGATYRIDRLVVDKDKVTIIDYKTGTTEDKEKYEQQIATYQSLVRSLYPGKTIHGILAFTDTNQIRILS